MKAIKTINNATSDTQGSATGTLPDAFVARDHAGLQGYAALLVRWNAKINLVGRQDIDQLWSRHIEDALFLYQCLPAGTPAAQQWVLDVGSGGGLPGMVLAIAAAEFAPERRFVLLDRSERKVRFLVQVAAELELGNVTPLCADFTQPIAAEHVGAAAGIPGQFDVVCARAVAPPDTLWRDVRHALIPGGQLLVACGPETRTHLPPGVEVEWLPDPAAQENQSERGVVRLLANS